MRLPDTDNHAMLTAELELDSAHSVIRELRTKLWLGRAALHFVVSSKRLARQVGGHRSSRDRVTIFCKRFVPVNVADMYRMNF